MITIFLDKSFVRNYFDLFNEDSEIITHFQNHVIKQNQDFLLLTNYDSFDEIHANDEDFFMFSIIFEAIPKLVFSINKDVDEIIENPEYNKGHIVFLSDSISDEIGLLGERNGIEIISTSNLKEKWSKYMNYEDNEWTLALPDSVDDPNVFKSWENLDFLKLFPTNSLLLVDKYILSKDHNLNKNLIPLINQVIPLSKNSTLNLLILTEKISKKRVPLSESDYKLHTDRILNALKTQHPNTNFNISLAMLHKDFCRKGSVDFHDRYLYSNYFVIEATSGFDVFEKYGRKTINSKISVRTIFHRFERKVLPTHFSALKEYFNKLIEKEHYNFKCKYYPEPLKSSLIN